MMKACMLRAPAAIETNPLEYADAATPQPKSGEVLVRVRACGVCRTDLHVIEGELPPRKSPVIPGHQVIGIVEKQGENTRRRCFVRESLGSGRCGSRGSKRADAWAFMGLARQLTWRSKWHGTGMWMCLLPHAMFVTKNSRWSWARCGPEAPMMDLRISWTPPSYLHQPERLSRQR